MSYYSYRPVLTDEYFEGRPLRLDHQPQLLAGDTVVEDVYRIKQVAETPVRYSSEPIFFPEAPWETFIQSPFVLYDEDDGLYKMWYSTRHKNFNYDPDWETNLEAGNTDKMICYAESTDGVHFTRPELDLYPFGPWKKNNIVFADSDVGATAGAVILNPDKTNKAHKFIMVWNEGFGVRISYSADGKKWGDTQNVTNVPMDCSLVLAYDESRSMWQLFARPSIQAKSERLPSEPNVMPNMNYRRRITVMESPDLVSWTVPRIVFHPDEHWSASQADNIAFFTVGNYPVGYIHLFSVNNFHECIKQFMVPYFATGEDIFHLETLPDEKPVIERGPAGKFDEVMVNIHGSPMDLFGDGRSYFYYCGDNREHFYCAVETPDIVETCAKDSKGHNRVTKMSVGLLSFGKDRYCARVGDDFGGWLLTREFILDGSSIEINADVLPYGEIKAELVEGENGNVRGGRKISGFTLELSDSVTGDSLAHTLTWGGSSDISSLKGRAVFLRFSIKNAKLYTFTVKE